MKDRERSEWRPTAEIRNSSLVSVQRITEVYRRIRDSSGLVTRELLRLETETIDTPLESEDKILKRKVVTHVHDTYEHLHTAVLTYAKDAQFGRAKVLTNKDTVITFGLSESSAHLQFPSLLQTLYINGKLQKVNLNPPRPKLRNNNLSLYSLSLPQASFQLNNVESPYAQVRIMKPRFHNPSSGILIDTLLIATAQHADEVHITFGKDTLLMEGYNSLPNRDYVAEVPLNIDSQAVVDNVCGPNWAQSDVLAGITYTRR